MKNGEHCGILGENAGLELADPDPPRRLSQPLQEHGAQPAVLELVGNDEGHLGRARIFEPVIAAHRDDLTVVLDHVGRPVDAIDTGEMCDLGGLELPVRVEVAQVNRPGTQACVEPQERCGIGRSNRPHAEAIARTKPFFAGRNSPRQ